MCHHCQDKLTLFSLLDAATARIAELERERSEDSKRLDYCQSEGELGAVIWRGEGCLGWLVVGQKTLHPTLREAIDAARAAQETAYRAPKTWTI